MGGRTAQEINLNRVDHPNFEFRYFPAEDLTFIAFNNQNNGAYDDLRKNIVKLITGWR